MTNLYHYIFTITVPMATKLDKMVTYFDGLLRIKLHDSLITWSCKITWQTKIILSSLPKCIWLPHLARPSLTLMGSCPWSCMILRLGGFVRSRDSIKSLYLYYHNIHHHKTRQDNDLPWLSFTHKVKWPHNQVVLWDHVTN